MSIIARPTSMRWCRLIANYRSCHCFKNLNLCHSLPALDLCPTHRTMSTDAVKYTCVHVFIKIKPGTEEAFKEITLKNARNSAKEDGVARFDVLQDEEDPSKFVLVEVYKNENAPAKHKETAHYLEWRDTVADMMAEPRVARRFNHVFPTTAVGWDYPSNDKLE